jgi:predicted ester cyclase
MIDFSLNLWFVAALSLFLSMPVLATGSVTIEDLVVADQISTARRVDVEKAVRAFYGFWNTGDEALLKEAIAPNFLDHTLPPNRPQGPAGPAAASHQFRAAVPDLKVTVKKMIIADDYVTVHMEFSGHFTGSFGQVLGKSQPIAFIATDLVKVADGRIVDNWHIEDNLTLLRQMGVVAP